jgi:hypothetical protein
VCTIYPKSRSTIMCLRVWLTGLFDWIRCMLRCLDELVRLSTCLEEAVFGCWGIGGRTKSSLSEPANTRTKHRRRCAHRMLQPLGAVLTLERSTWVGTNLHCASRLSQKDEFDDLASTRELPNQKLSCAELHSQCALVCTLSQEADGFGPFPDSM